MAAPPLMYCDNCDAFQPFWSEPYHPPLTDAPDEQGFLFSDQVCTVCRSIIATARKPVAIADASSA